MKATSAVLLAGKGRINVRRIAPILILLAMLLILSIFNAEFFSVGTFKNLMLQVSAVGVVALGAMVVIISGGIDFTTGFGLAMIGMASATVYASSFGSESFFILVVVALFAGAVLGLVNGFLIGVLKVLPFIATLAVMSIAQGLSLLIGGGAMVLFKNPVMQFIGQGYLLDVIPASFVVFLLMCLVTYLILNKTRLGVYAYAMGGNEDAARYMGVNLVKYKILVYIFGGLCTAIASVLTLCRISMATPSIYGTTLLDAIAAAVIGGTSMAGGIGRVFNTVIGTFIIVLISTALIYLNIQAEMQQVFKGGVILFAVCLDSYFIGLSKE